ncbi:MAG TPA: SulP family inorganic anion transporter [Acidimicrobiia bacterium]|nr:SulP family inorganic anion transporter [Acidimicrobiia bacterium]
MERRDRLLLRIPGVALARSYRREDLARDLTAGVVLAAMLVPQGMAYAELTGLPPQTGLYTTVAALLAYAVFGTNRVLILGPDSSLAPIVAAIVLPLAAGDAGSAIVLASALSLLTGLVCLGAGYARLGVVTELLSKPVRIGYLNGIAVVVLISQLPKALGFSVDADSTISTLVATFKAVVSGETVLAALMFSALSLLLIQITRRLWPGAPGVFVAVIGSLAGMALFDLAGVVETVGALPQGAPRLVFPRVGIGDLGALTVGAFGVALISFADTSALSNAMALRSGSRSTPNSEAKALGASNILSGLFQGFPTSASSSRTAVALSVGSRTQLTGIVAAVGVLALLVWAPGLLADLPSATLAAIVIAASFVIFDGTAFRWLWSVRRSEFLLSLGAFLGVVIIGVLEGILIAVVLSLANFIRRAWHPHSAELVRVHGLKGYHDRARHPDGMMIPGLLILRFDSPLFFANAPTFGRRLHYLLEEASRPLECVLVAGDAITDVDTTGAEVLVGVLDDLEKRGLTFAFAGLKGPVKDRLRAYGLYDRIGEANFFPTVGSAVRAHLRESESKG